MKRWQYLLFGFLALVAVAADELKPKPGPTVESLQAEIASLKSQLNKLQTTAVFEMKLCNASVQAAREFIAQSLGSPVGATSETEMRGGGPRRLPGSNPIPDGEKARIQPLRKP